MAVDQKSVLENLIKANKGGDESASENEVQNPAERKKPQPGETCPTCDQLVPEMEESS